MEAVDNEGKTPVDYVNNLGDGDRELMLAALQAGRLYGHSTIWTLVSRLNGLGMGLCGQHMHVAASFQAISSFFSMLKI